MNKKDFTLLLDELLELPQGTLKGDEVLKTIDWTSLSVIGFIALCDEQFEVAVSPSLIANATTINDLIGLLDDKVCS